MKIALAGFMGCGKSSIARRLSHELGYQMIDLDKFIEEGEKKSIADIFEKEGEGGFRLTEKKYLRIVLKKENTVIALGGGTPCYFDNMRLIMKNTCSVFLKISISELHRRLRKEQTKGNRPLINKFSSGELLHFIKSRLKAREKFYLQADIIVRAGMKSEAEIVDGIKKRIFFREHQVR